MLGITNKKLALCENEKVNLKQLLKNYENCLDTKEQEINLLLFEKDNWSKINEKNDDFNCGNFNLKQFIGEFLGKFRENCLDFDSEIKNTFESINESINLKIAYFQKLLKIIENLKNSKKIQKNSIELLINRLSETEKMIETLENSLKLNERAIFSYKSQVSQQENEKNMLKEALEKTLQNLHEKSKEIEELRKRKDEKLIQKIEEHDEKVLKLSKILQKYETQEQALNKRILNQSELIENLSENYENVKKTAETYKSELFIYLNSNKTESLEAENKKLQKKLKNLEKNLLKPEKIEKSEESICQRPLSHSQSSIKDEEIRELKEKLNSTSTELFLERQKTMKKKEEYEKLLMEATLFNTTKSRDNY
jgi:DNA repair exonuclease SbcCD ATPase subunit